jgi:hypothetical protein
MRKDMSYVHFGFDSGPLGGALVSLPGSSTWGEWGRVGVAGGRVAGQRCPSLVFTFHIPFECTSFPFSGVCFTKDRRFPAIADS